MRWKEHYGKVTNWVLEQIEETFSSSPLPRPAHVP